MSDLLLRVGVVRGGPGEEAEVSLSSGSTIIQAIKDHLSHKYRPYDIFVDRHGSWYIDGTPVTIDDLHSRIDVAFNALHGPYGENGRVQSILEWHGIPFTGTGSAGSAVSLNKVMSKNLFDSHGIKSPLGVLIRSDDIKDDPELVLKELWRSFILPGIVKPGSGSSSLGVSVVRNYDELESALIKASGYGDSVIIEEFIPGIEVTCGVIENFRSRRLYVLPPIEIRHSSEFFDYSSKYKNESQGMVPATFSDSLKRSIEDLAMKIHESFGLRHYSRSDFIIHPKRGVFVLEVNTLPSLTKESLFPKALRAVGSDIHHFVEHLVDMVRK